jgi:RNA polymerase sigma-70 factor (ECF subfamily)
VAPSPDPIAIPVDRATSGRQAADALLALYDEHESDIYRYALSATRDPEAAADLVQETFLRLLKESRGPGLPDNVRAWLYRVCANLVISQARRRTTARRFAPFLVDRREPVGTESQVVDRERNSEVEAALAGLPADARAGILLAAHGATGREIALHLGRSEGATRTLMSRARARLRTSLAAFEGAR